MSTYTARYLTDSQVDRKGFSDGRNGSYRFFDIGFDPRYDTAYLAGVRVRLFERPSSFVDNGATLKPGKGDLQ